MGDNVYVEPNVFSNCPALLVVYAWQDDHMVNVLATNHFIGIDDLLAQGGAIHIPEIPAVLPTHDPAPPYQPFLPSVSPEDPFCGDHPILTPIHLPNEFNYFIDSIFTFGTQLSCTDCTSNQHPAIPKLTTLSGTYSSPLKTLVTLSGKSKPKNTANMVIC